MSAGGFTTTIYEANAGTFHNMRVQPETLAATIGGTANAAAAGPVDSPFFAKVSKASTEYGLAPRFGVIRWDDDSAPTGYLESGTVAIPIMTRTLFDAASIGDAVAYNGGTGILVGKRAENQFPVA